MTTDGFDPAALLDEINTATAQVLDNAGRLDADQLAGPSLLPGWTRGHVLAHLARNADGLVNLFDWARTGVPTAMYGPGDARDRDIEASAHQTPEGHLADLRESHARLVAAISGMPATSWGAKVRNRHGHEFSAALIPYMRLKELYIHHVDLDAGWSPAHWPSDFTGRELAEIAADFRGRQDCPPVLLREESAGVVGRELRIGPDGVPVAVTVSGRPQGLLGWLIGRTNGDGLAVEPSGGLPPLPGWL